MTPEKKIAWLTVGMILCGLWTLNFVGVFIYAAFKGAFSEGADAIGILLTLIVFLIFAVLPGFIAWRCFKASRASAAKDKINSFTRERLNESVSTPLTAHPGQSIVYNAARGDEGKVSRDERRVK